jgi:hypothetical protein
MTKKIALLNCLGLSAGLLSGADYPQAEIANGQIRARLYLPDARRGFYRGTRFDWSGVISSLEYQGHHYYGPWFDRLDPQVRDFAYVGTEIVAGPCSAMTGPAEEFKSNGTALGWDEAKPGGTFIKIGVGVLRKDSEPYSYTKLYEIVNPGTWTVAPRNDAVEFTHDLTDPATGYGYLYAKTVRLKPGKPEMILEHRLKNTGRRTIQSTVYNHNFLVLDKQPPGPDFTITVPYPIQAIRPPDKNLAEIRGNQIVYRQALTGQDVVQTTLPGFRPDPRDHAIHIENAKVGAGLNITSDRPLSSHALWSIRSVLSMEPFIAMTIEPGGEFTWQTTYEYFVLAPR